MERCRNCGGQIIFRTKEDGTVYPIHLSGGCSDYNFQELEYTNKRQEQVFSHAYCPKIFAARQTVLIAIKRCILFVIMVDQCGQTSLVGLGLNTLVLRMTRHIFNYRKQQTKQQIPLCL